MKLFIIVFIGYTLKEYKIIYVKKKSLLIIVVNFEAVLYVSVSSNEGKKGNRKKTPTKLHLCELFFSISSHYIIIDSASIYVVLFRDIFLKQTDRYSDC